MDTLRGHKVEQLNGEWLYCDTKEPTVSTWKDRPCGHCGLHNTPEDHDGCLGKLPDVVNACCGHGDFREAYVEFDDGVIIRKMNAIRFIQNYKQEI